MQKDMQFPEKPIEIQMFGGFNITIDDIVISDTDTRTKQVWNLLQFLIASRNKTVSQKEIIKVMWDDDDIENPTNALKNLIYRIRMMFKDRGVPFYRDIIIYNKGVYQWNNEIPCVIDVEEFEKHCKKADDTSLHIDVRITEYKKAIEYYKGDFLPGSGSENWIIPISSYLRTLFFKCIYSKLELLSQKRTPESYEQIELLCRETLIKEPLEESLHYYLINSLYQQGKQAEAISHYKKMSDQFYRSLGIAPSDKLQRLYSKITKTAQNIQPNLRTIQDELREENNIEGAFYCEYEVFKNLYRLEARTAARTGKAMFVCLLTAEGLEESTADKNKTMDTLKNAIQQSLRKGDVYSRFSSVQYVLLLPTGNYENCEMVMNRVLGNYKAIYRGVPSPVHVKILPLEPIE